MTGAMASVFLVVDGHPVLHSKLLREFVGCLDGQPSLYSLAPYLAHLSFAGTVLSTANGQVACRNAATKDEYLAFLKDAKIRFGVMPELIRSLCRQTQSGYIMVNHYLPKSWHPVDQKGTK